MNDLLLAQSGAAGAAMLLLARGLPVISMVLLPLAAVVCVVLACDGPLIGLALDLLAGASP